MSSPKVAAKPARRPAASVKKIVAAKPVLTKPGATKPKVVATGLSADAIKLAGEIERAFQKSDQAISEEAMQVLMGTLCRVYSAQVENGFKYTPIAEGQAVSPTGVMVTASGLLRAANLAVFELGMWQSWTGR
jgi:hypothetical protein